MGRIAQVLCSEDGSPLIRSVAVALQDAAGHGVDPVSHIPDTGKTEPHEDAVFGCGSNSEDSDCILCPGVDHVHDITELGDIVTRIRTQHIPDLSFHPHIYVRVKLDAVVRRVPSESESSQEDKGADDEGDSRICLSPSGNPNRYSAYHHPETRDEIGPDLGD